MSVVEVRVFVLSLFTLIIYGCGSKNVQTPDNVLANLKVNANVATDSSGNVSFTATADNAFSFEFDFGNGIYQTVPSGTVSYRYPASGNYTVKVTAKNSAGQTLSQSIQLNVIIKLNLIWSDEFSNTGSPDPTKWGYDLGAGGWGNNELQYYTSRIDNAIVSNGTLKIIARKESYSNSNYTSARILTKGLFTFQYGRIDVSAKLPNAMGTWPAIWMLGSNFSTAGWPACGEIDIMEQSGTNKNTIAGTLHYPTQINPYGDGASTQVANSGSVFHKYSAIWNSSYIQFLVDDNPYYTLPNSNKLPFNQNFFILLNLAMGGNYGGSVDPAFTNDQLEIDYVRVYQ